MKKRLSLRKETVRHLNAGLGRMKHLASPRLRDKNGGWTPIVPLIPYTPVFSGCLCAPVYVKASIESISRTTDTVEDTTDKFSDSCPPPPKPMYDSVNRCASFKWMP